MKTRFSILLALALIQVGCSSGAPHTGTLTAIQAETLAQKLANDQALALFKCEPFQNGPPAKFVQGHWVWHDRRAQGHGDIEATVQFAADGANPDVNVNLLDGTSR